MSTRAAYLGQSDICSLGERVKELSIEVYGARKNEGVGQRSEFELMDILDELRAELVGPMRWPGTSLAPPDMAAIQVAFQRRFFQLVPRSREQAGELIDVESPTGDGGQRMMCLEHPSITAGTLAKKARMSEDQVVRIMRVLTTNLIFTESDEKVFAHTSISAGLANDLVAGRVGGIFNDLLKACSGLNDAIEHGQKSAWHERFGMSLYEHLETRSPADREGLAKSMTVTSIAEAEEVSKGFPWHRFKKVADVGGSFGRFVAGICKSHPHLSGVVQDLPEVIEDAQRRIVELPPEDQLAFKRIEFERYNYYAPQSRTDCDAFILRRCLHNNSDEDSVRILQAAVPGLIAGKPNSQLLVVEKLMPRWDEYSVRNEIKMLRREDLVMMISCGGKERSLQEFEELATCADSRYELDNVYRFKNHVAIIAFKMAL